MRKPNLRLPNMRIFFSCVYCTLVLRHDAWPFSFDYYAKAISVETRMAEGQSYSILRLDGSLQGLRRFA
jgi:hypothetical protein